MIPGVGRPDSGVNAEEKTAASVVPNFLPPMKAAAKQLPAERLRPLDDNSDVARLLGKILEASGMNPNQVAVAMGSNRQTIYNIQKGRRPDVTFRWLQRFCAATGARLYVALPRR